MPASGPFTGFCRATLRHQVLRGRNFSRTSLALALGPARDFEPQVPFLLPNFTGHQFVLVFIEY